MPKESLNIYLTATDTMSPVLASITDKTRALDKESQELAQTYEALQKANKGLIEKKTELQKKLQEVNEEVKEARKQFKELGNEASSDALNKATEKQQALRNEIAGTTKALQENQRIYKENIEIARKNALGGGEQDTSLKDMATGIVAGQIGQMFASSLGEAGQSLLTSAIGTPTASLISDTLSSAISGGAAGAMFGFPGIAAGVVLGGISGLISGGTKIFEAKDDAFKDYYGGLYDDVKGRSGEMVTAGSTIAGGREQTRMAFSQRLGGEDAAREYLKQVEVMAANTNYEYDEIVGYAKLLLNSYDPGEVFSVLQDLSDATAGLNLSSSDVNMMISGLSRMRTTGKATQEYLNYFRERGVDVDQALANDLGVDKSAVAGLVSKGQVGGEDAAAAILSFIQQEFGGLSEGLASTYDAMVDNLGDITASLQAAGGDAYNELRKESVEAEMNALGGELGEAIGEINRVIGENQARRENLEDQYMRETLEAVLLGKEGTLFDAAQQEALKGMAQEYAEAQKRYEKSERTDAEAGAQMERLKEQAEAMGKAYFENSDFVKMLNETEEEEVKAIREATAGLYEATQASYKLSQELSKGLGAIPRSISSADVDYRSLTWTDDGGNVHYAAGSEPDGWYDDGGNFHPHAFGLDRVPYDEYPALLHEGERVLTASEARAQDMAQAGAVPIQSIVSGNTFVGVTEEMADQLWAIIVRNLEREARARAPK